MSKSFVIYLPSYNAAKTLPGVLDRIPPEIRDAAASILVVDNCSTDDTSLVANQYRKKHSLKNMVVRTMTQNLGYGGSQKFAYRFCIDHGVDIVVMLHADGQYAPELLGGLMEPVLSGRADMVFGSRIKGNPLKGGMPLHRFLGNRALTTIQNLLLRTNLSEFHSGYRIFNVASLSGLSFESLSSDFHFDTEMIILHVRAGRKIEEIAIPTYYGEEENYVNIWSYGSQVLVTTITYMLNNLGLRKSKSWHRILAAQAELQVQKPAERRRMVGNVINSDQCDSI